MFFNGRFAEFGGGVQADQESAHLTCRTLQVYFDRAISLKEGNRGGDGPGARPARVRNLVCNRDVSIEERVLDGAKLMKYQRIQAPELAMNAIEPDDGAAADGASEGNEVRIPRGGDLRVFQRGGPDPAATPGPAAPAKPADKSDDRLKLTYVQFAGSMYANSKTHTATFLQNVRVLNMPCEDVQTKIDLDELLPTLPQGAMYLRADKLVAFDRGDKTKSKQELTATGGVVVQAREFYGRSNVLTYNEEKDQVILEGGDGGLATLYKVKQKGGKPQEIKGKKITYIRSTGVYRIEGGEWITGE
jgi:hypothetical protein